MCIRDRGLGIILFLSMRPSLATLALLAPILPSILFYAALNAFNEEMTYRAPMLATLEPVGGSRQALWMSAAFFGIAHFYGTPGGILGAIASLFMGWILGKDVYKRQRCGCARIGAPTSSSVCSTPPCRSP